MDLKPCPFCGSDMDGFVTGFDGSTHESGHLFIECDCGAMGPRGRTIEEAVAAWNRRAPGTVSSD